MAFLLKLLFMMPINEIQNKHLQDDRIRDIVILSFFCKWYYFCTFQATNKKI